MWRSNHGAALFIGHFRFLHFTENEVLGVDTKPTPNNFNHNLLLIRT